MALCVVGWRDSRRGWRRLQRRPLQATLIGCVSKSHPLSRLSRTCLMRPKDIGACSLLERVARLHGLTGGMAFSWWPALRAARRG